MQCRPPVLDALVSHVAVHCHHKSFLLMTCCFVCVDLILNMLCIPKFYEIQRLTNVRFVAQFWAWSSITHPPSPCLHSIKLFLSEISLMTTFHNDFDICAHSCSIIVQHATVHPELKLLALQKTKWSTTSIKKLMSLDRQSKAIVQTTSLITNLQILHRAIVRIVPSAYPRASTLLLVGPTS